MKPEPQKPESQKVISSTTTKVKTTCPPASSTVSLTLLNSLQEIRQRLEMAESGLTSHLHIPLGENSVHECSVHIQKLQVCNRFWFFFSCNV